METRKIVRSFNKYQVFKSDENDGWEKSGKLYDIRSLDSLLRWNWDKENQRPKFYKFLGSVEIAKEVKEYNERRKIEENWAKKDSR